MSNTEPQITTVRPRSDRERSWALRLRRLTFAVLLAGLSGSALWPSQAFAQSGASGGSQRVGNRSGFGCGPGMGWVQGDDGVARCRVNAPAQGITATSCAANTNYTTPTGGACIFSLPTTSGGATISVRNTNTGTHTGSLALDCNASNGQWVNPVASCVELPRVTGLSVGSSTVLINAGQTLSWSSTAATSATLSCSGLNPYSGSGLAANGNVSVPTSNEGGTTCSVTVTGPGGTSGASTVSWTARVSAACPAQSIQPGACGYPIPALASGQQQTTSTTTGGYTGSIISRCTDGNWTYSGATCTATSNPCAASTLSAGSCTYPVNGLGHNQTASVTNNASGWTGSATALCTNGTWSLSGAICVAVASAPSSTWQLVYLSNWLTNEFAANRCLSLNALPNGSCPTQGAMCYYGYSSQGGPILRHGNVGHMQHNMEINIWALSCQ